MSLTIVNAADLHLDIAGSWDESQRQINSIVDICNERQASLLTIGGDVFNTGRPTPEAVALFVDAMKRLDVTKAIIGSGNHDQQGVVGKHRGPIEAYLSDYDWCYAAVPFAEVVTFEDVDIMMVPWHRVAGQSLLEQTNMDIRDNISRLYDQVKRPSLLVGHLTVDECVIGTSSRGTEIQMMTSVLEASVPVSFLDEGPQFLSRLGHIHKRQNLSKKSGYTGSMYKVSFSERDEAKGIDIITMTDKKAKLEFHQLDVREMYQIDVSSDNPNAKNEVAELLDTIKSGDLVKLIADSHDDTKNHRKLLRGLDKLGIQPPRIERKFVPRKKTETRHAQLPVNIDTVSALNAWMDLKDIDKGQRDTIRQEFADITASVE